MKYIDGKIVKLIKELVVLVVLYAFGANSAFSQIDPGLRMWIRVGVFQHFVASYGAERAYNDNKSYYEGYIWPAWFNETDNFVIDRFFLASKDFTDYEGLHWDYKATFLYSDSDPLHITPISLSQTSIRSLPIVDVDGVSAIREAEIDSLHDLSLKADRIVTNVVNTCMGITITRKVYAFSQEYHDDYFIYETILENTGNMDADPEPELSDTVHSFYFGGITRFATCREGSNLVDRQNTWGAHQWIHYTPNGDYPTKDSLRCFYGWFGQSSNISTYNNVGAPIRSTNVGDGRLTAPQFSGMVFIHSDTSPQDTSDNPNLPILGWHAGDAYPSVGPASGVEAMRSVWNMLAGIDLYTGDIVNQMDKDHVIADMKAPQKVSGNDGGGAAGFFSYGPYTLAPGEKIKIVHAKAVGGLDRHKCITIGRKWLEKYNNPGLDIDFGLPKNTTTKDKDIYKDTWVYTGKDSIFQTFSRAVRNYKSGYNIPQPPPPPNEFHVLSLGDKINLTWSNESEQDPNFAGYKIFRAQASADSFYHEIFACGEGTNNPTIVKSFDDMSAIRGISYYYYISSYCLGDNNTTDLNPHGMLLSGRAYNQTTEPAYLKRTAGSLDKIRVVPNPWNISNRRLQYGEGGDKDKLMFLDVPGYCKIKIFTERGDLIKVIDHNDGSGDQAWNLTTDSRQIIVSGIYIAYFETPDGKSIFQKFVVIR